MYNKLNLRKFPIWLLASTAFFGSFRVLRSAIDDVITLDSKLTTLNRTLTDGADINRVFSDGIQLANKLSVSIEEITDALITFSRQGFLVEEIAKLGEAATLASIVGNTTVDEAASNVTAIMKVYEVGIDDVVTDIIDKINEIDLNFAVTTPQIMDAMKKSASTAKTFGSELENLASYATAIGVQTRESGNVIGNSLKSIFSRLVMSQSVNALEEVGVKVRDINGENLKADQILENLHSRWGDLTSTQQQNVAVTVAGRYQLSRFLALMNGFEIATEAQEKMNDSLGSSYKEAEKWNQSLEARLNRMRNQLTELSLTVGDAFLTDSIVLFTEEIGSLAKSSSEVVKAIGFLPPVIGLVTVAIITMNSSMRTSVTNMGLAASSSKSLTGALTLLRSGAIATGAAFTTLKSFMIGAFPPVAIIMGVTFALEKLFSAIMNQRKEQRELQKETEDLISTYGENSKQVQTLAKDYEALSQKINSGEYSAKEHEDYLRVQNELGELLPHLVDKIDEKGQAHLRSAEAITKEVSALEELRSIESEKFLANFESNLDVVNDKISETEEKVRSIGNSMQEIIKKSQVEMKYTPGMGHQAVPKEESEVSLEDQAKKIILERELNSEIENRSKLYEELASAYADRMGTQTLVTQQDKEYIRTLIEQKKELLETEEGQSKLTEQIKSLVINMGDLREAVGTGIDLSSILDLDQDFNVFSEDKINALKLLNDEVSNSNPNWEKLQSNLQKAGFSLQEAEEIVKTFNTEYQKTQQLIDMGLFEDLEGTIPITTHERYNEILSESGEVFRMVNGEIVAFTDSLDDNADSIGNAEEALKAITDQYNNASNAISDLNGIIDKLNEGNGITSDMMDTIMNKYPHLLAYIGDEEEFRRQVIVAIEDQEKIALSSLHNQLMASSSFINHVTKNHADFYSWLKNTYSVDLKNFKSLADAKAQVEDQLINSMSKKWSVFYNATTKSLSQAGQALLNHTPTAFKFNSESGTSLTSQMRAHKMLNDNQQRMSSQLRYDMIKLEGELSQAGAKFNEITSYTISAGTGGANFSSPSRGSSSGGGGKGSSRSSKPKSSGSSKSSSANQKSPEEIAWERAEKALEKYTRKLDEYDYKIDREKLLREQMTEGSAKYNNSINKEINLLEGRKKELNKYISAMQSTIKQDKISSDNKKKLTDDIRKMSNEYLQLDNQIQNYINTQRKSLADESIKILQDAMNKRIELLQKERDKEVSLLDERLKAYEDYVNAKLKQLDREEKEDDFRQSEQELMNKQIELQRQIDILSLNNTQEATARRRELQEQLTKTMLELDEMREKRTSELRKQSLQDELDKVREETEQKQESITKEYDAQTHKLEEQLKNEEYFAKLREEVMAGNMKNIQNIINGYLKDFKSYNKSVIDDLGSSWQELTNLIKGVDKLSKDTSNASKGVVTNSTKSANNSSNKNNSSSSGNKSGSNSSSSGSNNKSNLPVRKHPTGYATPKGGWDSRSITDYIKSKGYYAEMSDRDKLFKHFNGQGQYTGSNSQNDWLLKQLKIVGFRSGGYTGNQEGMAYIHKKEQVLNESDTKGFFRAVEQSTKILPAIAKIMDFSKIAPKATTSTSSSNKYHIEFNVNGSLTKSDATTFGKTFMDYVKRSGG